jgi:hypothetical protein
MSVRPYSHLTDVVPRTIITTLACYRAYLQAGEFPLPEAAYLARGPVARAVFLSSVLVRRELYLFLVLQR